jgi:hypothetical protein
MLAMLAYYVTAVMLDCRARWHFRQIERHERLLCQHAWALRELRPRAERLQLRLGVDDAA